MSDLPTEAIAELEAGRKIEAIKIVREQERLGLKEAKLRVEGWVRDNPGRVPERQASGAGWFGWLLSGAILGWLACRFGG